MYIWRNLIVGLWWQQLSMSRYHCVTTRGGGVCAPVLLSCTWKLFKRWLTNCQSSTESTWGTWSPQLGGESLCWKWRTIVEHRPRWLVSSSHERELAPGPGQFDNCRGSTMAKTKSQVVGRRCLQLGGGSPSPRAVTYSNSSYSTPPNCHYQVATGHNSSHRTIQWCSQQ